MARRSARVPPAPGGGSQGGGPARPWHGCPVPAARPRCARSGRLGGGAPALTCWGCLSASEKCRFRPSACFSAGSCLSVCPGGRQAPHAAWMATLSWSRGAHTFPPVHGLPFPSDGGFFGFTEVLRLNVAHPISAACPVRSVLRSDAFSLFPGVHSHCRVLRLRGFLVCTRTVSE